MINPQMSALRATPVIDLLMQDCNTSRDELQGGRTMSFSRMGIATAAAVVSLFPAGAIAQQAPRPIAKGTWTPRRPCTDGKDVQKTTVTYFACNGRWVRFPYSDAEVNTAGEDPDELLDAAAQQELYDPN